MSIWEEETRALEGTFEVILVEVPLVGSSEATEAVIVPPIATAVVDGLLQQSKEYYKSQFVFVQGLVLYGTVNYWEVVMMPILIAYAGFYVAPWVYKLQIWTCTLPVFSRFEFKLLIVGVLLVGVLVRHVLGYVRGIGFI